MTYVYILNPCYDGNAHTYATTKEMKTMAFRINSSNTKQAIGIQVTCITERRLQKELFLAKKNSLSYHLCVHFVPLLGWEYIYVWRD